jgi:hypothetical protein
MVDEKEKVACKFQPEQLELVRRWVDELDGSNRNIAFELLNQVMEGEIMNAAAFALLECKCNRVF